MKSISTIKNSIFGRVRSAFQPKAKLKGSVAVGLSGGVDSAVSALLLKNAGYAVTGIFIRTWHPEGYPCTEGEDKEEAVRVATHLNIPFEELDLSEKYKNEVADKMLLAYACGLTPNPDILCNREVKFGTFAKEALKRFDFIATGHYASTGFSKEGKVLIKESADKKKDQTYFLASVPKDILACTIFPVGELQKTQVRNLALKFGLPNAERKDSQGICFLGEINLKKYLTEKLKLESGKVLDSAGKVIGTHNGVPLYTFGERRGFQVSAKSPESKPMFVIGKDIKNNILVVGSKEEKNDSGYKVVSLSPFNDFSGTGDFEGEARIRHRGEKIPCKVELTGAGSKVVFNQPVLVAPGQWLALYRDGLLMAGGEVQGGL